MRRSLDTTRWLLAACLVLGLALPAWAAKTPDELPDGGTANAAPPAARISYLDGTLYCWGPFDDEKRHLMFNDIVREGDELYAAPGTYVEVEFPGAAYLRMDGGSSIVVQHYRDDLELIPTAGAFYVSTGDWSRGAVRFGPDGVDVSSASLVRMDISPDEYRRVGVAHGLARLDGDDFSLELVDNDQAWAERFDTRWEMGRFAPRDGDDFDLWSLDRELELRRPLEEDTPSYPLVGYSELTDQGTWVVADGVWVWRPYVEAGWRPFTQGEWVWVAGYGWTWTSGHRWGYVTSHHGRWVYDSFYGWVWMPGMTWAPAWVTWSVHGSNVGWCPIDWWGYPVVITVGWYSYWDYRCWTFCHHDYFYHGGYHHNGAYHWGSHHGSGHGHHGSSHGHGNSHHRHSSSHDSHQASSSHARDEGGSASHARDSDAANPRAHAYGSDFRTFDKGEFESASPVAVRDANTQLLCKDTLDPSDRQSYERGGDSRDSLIAQRFPADRGGAAGNRTSRGTPDGGSATATSRGESAKEGSGTARGISGNSGSSSSVGERASRSAAETSSRDGSGERGTTTQPSRSATSDVDRGTTSQPSDRSSSSSTGDRSTYTPVERSSSSSSSTTPYVPRYNGRSDGEKGYSGSSSSSSSSSRSSTSSGSTTTRPRSSTSSSSSSSSTRSRSSSSGSKSKSSSSSSRSSSSGSKKSSSGSKKSSSSSKKSSGSKKRK